MDDITVTRTGLTALIAVITYLSGQFGDLFWILCMLMLIDYITGFIAAWINKTKNSRIGLIGIVKKIMYIMSVVFGFILDMSLMRIFGQLHIEFISSILDTISLGIILIVFYIGNETISIVENFEKMGIRLPKWIKRIGKMIKDIPNTIIDGFIRSGEKYITGEKNKNDSINPKSKKKGTTNNDKE